MRRRAKNDSADRIAFSAFATKCVAVVFGESNSRIGFPRGGEGREGRKARIGFVNGHGVRGREGREGFVSLKFSRRTNRRRERSPRFAGVGLSGKVEVNRPINIDRIRSRGSTRVVLGLESSVLRLMRGMRGGRRLLGVVEGRRARQRRVRRTEGFVGGSGQYGVDFFVLGFGYFPNLSDELEEGRTATVLDDLRFDPSVSTGE